MEKEGDDQEWEFSKENVIPIKEGRNIDSLNYALSQKTPEQNRSLESKIKEQERKIEDYIGSDPLTPWIDYIKWTQENCPTDSKTYIHVIERCLQKFSDSRLYAQDFRFLRIWILYINSQDFQNAKHTFAFMRSHSIGMKFAFFFLAEALVYEQNGEYEKTEKIYQEGITSCAEPVKDIIKHQKQFHRRMRRKCINICNAQHSKGEQVDPLLQHVEMEGITMSAIRRLEEIEKQTKSVNSNRNFGVLQEVHKTPVGTTFSQSQGLTTKETQKSSLSWTPFEESKSIKEETPEIPWNRFEPESIQSKENNQIVSKWSEVRLKQKLPTTATKKLPFSIYHEPTQSEKVESTPKVVKKQLLRRESKQPFGYNRELFIQGTTIEDEISFEEYRAQFYTVLPEMSYKTPQKQTTDSYAMDTEYPSSSTPDNSIRKRLDFDPNFNGLVTPIPSKAQTTDDMTVNTRGVLNEMSAIFGSTDWVSKHEDKHPFDILSTVKKSQKRSYINPNSIQQSNDEQNESYHYTEEDKENMPISYLEKLAKQNQDATSKLANHDSIQNIIGDVDVNDEGSITAEESKHIQLLLSSQSQSRKSSISTTNRISDIDDSASFMTGRRDTADMTLLHGLQELFDKSTDSNKKTS